MYLERLSSYGIDTSPYYVPNGRFNTAPADDDNQMPNCTMYCFCRGYEAMDATERTPWVRPQGGFGSAKEWYCTTTMPKGSQLRTGSVACFDGNYGHVAFVERKIDDTHALISESQYDHDKSLRNYKYWQKRVVELIVGKATLSGVGALQGFIYLPIKDIRTVRNTEKVQISINDEMVNVRGLPNGEVARKGCYAPTGIYDVLEEKIIDGYDWYRIAKSCWVREGDWLTYYPQSDDISKLQAENEMLRKKISEIQRICEEDIL